MQDERVRGGRRQTYRSDETWSGSRGPEEAGGWAAIGLPARVRGRWYGVVWAMAACFEATVSEDGCKVAS
jgi:hypothetical protein